MPFICAKFGGTSLATGKRFLNVARIVRSSHERRLIVVSAPGRRFDGDEKVTDLLLKYFRTRSEEVWREIRARFDGILGADAARAMDRARESILEFDSEDYALSRGEYLSARAMARLLDFDFVDAASCVRMDKNGRILMRETEEAIRAVFDPARGAVIPGFYGADEAGCVRVFPRGGSDITGAVCARAIGARLYENWTDVDGVYDRNPSEPGARLLNALSFDGMRDLVRRGAQVLHPDSLAPVEEKGIPVRVRNTFRPSAPGTWILPRDLEAPDAPKTDKTR